MTDQFNNLDPQKLIENVYNTFTKYQKAFAELSMNHLCNNNNLDPLHMSEIFIKVLNEFYTNPQKISDIYMQLLNNYLQLMESMLESLNTTQYTPKFNSSSKDNRFNDEIWSENPIYSFLRQSYYMHLDWSKSVVNNLSDLTTKEKHKLDFVTRQFYDALSPTNFANINPKVIKETLNSNGENLLKGAENFAHDATRSKDGFSISTISSDAFKVGESVAITKGKVVYQNELMQLIQYEATTEKVCDIPIIIMPAWINKYYILDLSCHNSFVKWVVDKGYTVFMISWINPDKSMSNTTFTDYMRLGPLAAIDVVKDITKVHHVNFVGYCLGGTLLAITLSYLIEKDKNSIKSSTFLATMVDFKEVGDMEVFIDDMQLESLEKRMENLGYLEGNDMMQTFLLLRANDMIWSFYINNYLLGKEPFAFDILYWNADSTRLPAKMHSFYLRNMYQNNMLVKGIKIDDIDIDLKKINIPTYIFATKEDHIAPWQSVYEATQIYSGDIRFVLSASGHVAGVVNHPLKNKYNYWVNEKLSRNYEEWLNGAQSYDGSWWIDWENWLKQQSGSLVKSRVIKNSLEDAPGSYVKVKLT